MFLVATRSLRGTPDTVMAGWQMGTALILGIVTAPFVWVTPQTWYDGLLLCLLGVVSLIAIVCVNRSLKLAPASVVVPYQYMLIVWAIVFGYLVFSDVPEWPMLVGAAIIIGAGLFIFFREQRLAKPVQIEFPPDR
jgi:drug/metabolite transporter (DMT)-like permease